MILILHDGLLKKYISNVFTYFLFCFVLQQFSPFFSLLFFKQMAKLSNCSFKCLDIPVGGGKLLFLSEHPFKAATYQASCRQMFTGAHSEMLLLYNLYNIFFICFVSVYWRPTIASY